MKKPIKELNEITLHNIDCAIKNALTDDTKQDDKVMARPTMKQSLINKLSDELLEDSLWDLAGYSILGLKYLKEHEND